MSSNDLQNRQDRRQINDALALALAQGRTMIEAADEVGISAKTVQRRLKRKVFRDKVSRLRRQILDTALGQLTDGMSEAAAKLRELLNADSESVRLGAARTLLETGLKGHEILNLNSKLEQLEAVVAEINKQNEGARS